ncbi:flagellar basal body L-ring protein FlgH [Oceanicoccus sagamiensis]|uniref:Flagellar L-ring protein n=1 Tax=Oceanicoccus sagamiensis TaxID=716816 RepID=A0A1X9N4J1_9GAMM|nr:flagellar basal body L-ring protein FlgH [Oceanicoccus sagamiensis]ARN73058.1 flagellar basal body L-ring protein [Oceanicoccus sagamiensis]
MNMFIRHSLLVMVTAMLGACTIGPEPLPDDPAYAPVIPASTEIPQPNRGGIYRPNFSVALFEDRRATRVGDIISVILSERTQSSKSADTEITKENDISFEAGNILGVPPSLGDYNLQTEVSQNRELTGEASSDQSNSLSGSIAVTVSEILPNGLMVVRGEKWMTFNRGEEFIRIRGLIRQEDVQPDNTILSTRLADARITYSGTGDLADANKQGWGSRFFNSEYWPF